MLLTLYLLICLFLPHSHAFKLRYQPIDLSILDTGYDEDLARLLLLFASAAYIPSPGHCLDNLIAAPNITNFSVDDDYFNVTHTFTGTLYNSVLFGFLAIDHNHKRWILSYRGTWGTQQLLTEIRHTAASISPHDKTHKIVSYFYSAATLLRDDSLNAIRYTVEKYPDYQAYFTGHSLGGALTSLIAYEALQADLLQQPISYTFGQPRTGNYQWALYMNQRMRQYRVVHARDAVPHLPPCPTAGHVCVASNHTHPLVFSYHSGIEIFYPNFMPPLFETNELYITSDLKEVPQSSSFVECIGEPLSEDAECSNSLFMKSISDHLKYFSVNIGGLCLPWQTGEYQVVPKNTIENNEEARKQYEKWPEDV